MTGEALSVDVTVTWATDATPPAVTEPDLAEVLRVGLEAEAQSGAWEVAVRFVDDAEMRRLHEQFLDDASSTDIMTFPWDAEDGPGGDVLISVDTAAEQADAHGWPIADELRFLVLHGLLHLLGWDDHTDTDRNVMLARQMDLLDRWRSRRATT